MIVNHILYEQGSSAPLSQFCPIQIGDIPFYIVFPLTPKEANKLKSDLEKLKIHILEILESSAKTLSIDEIASTLRLKYYKMILLILFFRFHDFQNYKYTQIYNLILQAAQKLPDRIRIDEDDSGRIFFFFIIIISNS